jgi:hypothetical protein
MILLKSVVGVAARSMSHLSAEHSPDRSGIGVMAVCRDPCRRDAGHRPGRSKECFSGRQVAALAQHDIDQGAVAINRTIQIPPLPGMKDSDAWWEEIRLARLADELRANDRSDAPAVQKIRRSLVGSASGCALIRVHSLSHVCRLH